MSEEMKRPTSHISGNSIKPALSKAVEFYTDNNRQAYECIHERDEYIDYLESQLSNAKPQQALPVVPECVAEQIERIKKSNNSYASLGLFDSNYERKPKYAKWIQNSINEFMVACTIGYTVEKQQLFYLRDELTGQFLAKDNQFKDKDRYFFWTGADPLTHSIGTAWKLTFTQEEIDSMQTGSYEQIEVKE